MYVSPINPNNNGKPKKQSTRQLILIAFSTNPQMAFKEVHKELLAMGWKQPASSDISTKLSELTNEGLLRQIGANSEGKTVWERTALKNPMPDEGKFFINWHGQKKELDTDMVKTILSDMKGSMTTLNNIYLQGQTPNLSILQDYLDRLGRVLQRYEGHTDRTKEAEFIRRVSQGL